MDWPEFTRPERPSTSERFWAKVDTSGDCWLWMASLLPNGYGQFNYTTAHRFAVIDLGIEVRADQVVDHLCRNKKCVNPAHLEVTTQSVNVRRGYGPNVAAARERRRSSTRTHCVNGHAMTDGNTYRPPSQPTWRICRQCRRGVQARWRAKAA